MWQKEWDKQSYGEPALIQSTLYPLLLESESVLGISPTGSGKTVAYLLPLLQKVIQGNEEQLAKMTEEDIRTILSIGE